MTETLATDTTEVRFLPTVDPQVLSQGRPIGRKAARRYTWIFAAQHLRAEL